MAVMEDICADNATLVPAEDADIPVLSELYIQMYEAHGAKITSEAASTKLAKVLQAPGQRGLLFMYDNQPIGFTIWADLGDHVFIRGYVIDAAYRGRGLGSALFARLRAESLPSGLPLRLEASADHALGFWAAQGFSVWSSGMRTDAIEEHP